MKISELYQSEKPVLSLEIFPPKKAVDLGEAEDALLDELSQLKPGFISVTCGAGGSSNRRNKTIDLAAKIIQQYGVTSMAHLTCVAASKETIRKELEEIRANGIENVLALRGDLPEGVQTAGGDYLYAKDLIADLKEQGDLCIAAAAYPEGHITCDDFNISIAHLKQKEEAGASVFVSQLFFDNRCFYELQERAAAAGIKAPIAAGIMPMLSKAQIQNMIFLCGASLPSKMIKLLNKYQNDTDSLVAAGLTYAGEQIVDLQRHGVQGIHLYTMNRPYIAKTLYAYIEK